MRMYVIRRQGGVINLTDQTDSHLNADRSGRCCQVELTDLTVADTDTSVHSRRFSGFL